jgi:hypothetical protein
MLKAITGRDIGIVRLNQLIEVCQKGGIWQPFARRLGFRGNRETVLATALEMRADVKNW